MFNVRIQYLPSKAYGSVARVGIHALAVSMEELTDHICVAERDLFENIFIYQDLKRPIKEIKKFVEAYTGCKCVVVDSNELVIKIQGR